MWPGLLGPRTASDGEAHISQAWREEGADPGRGVPGGRPCRPSSAGSPQPARLSPRQPPGPCPRQPLLQAPRAGRGTAPAPRPRCRGRRIPQPLHQRGRPPTGFPAAARSAPHPAASGSVARPRPGPSPTPVPARRSRPPAVCALRPRPCPTSPNPTSETPALSHLPGPPQDPCRARGSRPAPLSPGPRVPELGGLPRPPAAARGPPGRAEPYFGRWRCGPRQPCPERRLFWAGPAEQLWSQGFPAGCAPGTEGTLGQGSPPSPPSSQAAPSSSPFWPDPGPLLGQEHSLVSGHRQSVSRRCGHRAPSSIAPCRRRHPGGVPPAPTSLWGALPSTLCLYLGVVPGPCVRSPAFLARSPSPTCL